MKRVSMEELEPGMVIARTVIGSDGRALLTENCQLSEAYIERLQLLGFKSVYIKDGLADIDIPQVVSNQVLSAVSSTLSNSIKTYSTKKTLDLKSLRIVVTMLLDDILSNHNLLIQLEDIRTHDDYLFFHSINVAIFSILTAITMGYTEGKVIDIGLGALLHDIGMIMIDPAIINKSAQLSESESAQIRKHPEIGFNILRTYREVPTKVAHIAYQHHERVDGSGYPRMLERKQILEYALIVAVADTFDAVVSDRPFRKGYSTTEALIILRKLSNSYYDPEIVEAFASNIAIYPVGCLLSLNTGHIALVTSVTRISSTRPTVHVICDRNYNLIHPPFEIDLQKTTEISILKRLSNEETDIVRSKIYMQKNEARTESCVG